MTSWDWLRRKVEVLWRLSCKLTAANYNTDSYFHVDKTSWEELIAAVAGATCEQVCA